RTELCLGEVRAGFGRHDHSDQREHEPAQHDAAPVARPPLREALPERSPGCPPAPGDGPGAPGAVWRARPDGGEGRVQRDSPPDGRAHIPVPAFRPRFGECLAHHDPSRRSPTGPAPWTGTVGQYLTGERSGFPDTCPRVATRLPSDLSRYIVQGDVGFPAFATEGTMATGYNVRVGDADREAVAAQLREHYADGRLTLEELNERIDQTF